MDVEGLRAVAVLAVLGFHARVPGIGGGFVGVDVFYVISGYLITGLLLREIETSGRIELLAFYARRARRLLPAALFVIVVTVCLSYLVLTRTEFVQLLGDAAAASVYASNIRFAATATDYFASTEFPSPLLHFWTLAVEEQFYLFWPLLLLVASRVTGLRRLWLPVALLGAISFVASLLVSRVEPAWAFYSLPTRSWELAIGALIALRLRTSAVSPPGWTSTVVSLAGIALIVLSAAVAGETGPQWLAVAGLPAAVGAAAIIVAGEWAATPVFRFLSTRPMRWLGRISYSLYLWHWPILLLIPRLTDHHGLGTRLALAAGTVVIAALSTRFIEDPFRFKLSRGRSSRTVLAAGLSSSVLIAVVTSGIAGVPSPGTTAPPPVALPVDEEPSAMRPVFSGPVPPDLVPSLDRARDDVTRIDIAGCQLAGSLSTPEGCILGEPEATTTVVVVGDSKAAQWIPAVEVLAAEHHWRVIRMTKGRCPFVDLTVWDPVLDQPYVACDEWRAAALQIIEREHPAIVFVATRRPSELRIEHGVTMSSWEEGLRAALLAAARYTDRVVYLGDTPHVKNPPITCLEREQRLEACPTVMPPAEFRRLEEAATAGAAVELVTTLDWLCVDSRCPLVLDHYLVYHDQYHLTATMSARLAPALDWALRHPAGVGAAPGPTP